MPTVKPHSQNTWASVDGTIAHRTAVVPALSGRAWRSGDEINDRGARSAALPQSEQHPRSRSHRLQARDLHSVLCGRRRPIAFAEIGIDTSTARTAADGRTIDSIQARRSARIRMVVAIGSSRAKGRVPFRVGTSQQLGHGST
jgi:hypothetical protein